MKLPIYNVLSSSNSQNFSFHSNHNILIQSLKREEINGQSALKKDLNLLLSPKGSLQLRKCFLQFGKYSLNCIKHLDFASWHKRFTAIEERFPAVGKRFTALHKRFIRSKLTISLLQSSLWGISSNTLRATISEFKNRSR